MHDFACLERRLVIEIETDEKHLDSNDGKKKDQWLKNRDYMVLYFKELEVSRNLGGVISTIADNAAGFAAYSLMPEDCQPLSIEFKVSLLSVATGKPLIARAEVLKAGRKIFHIRSDVLIVEEGDEELIATALATIKSSKSVKEI